MRQQPVAEPAIAARLAHRDPGNQKLARLIATDLQAEVLQLDRVEAQLPEEQG
jgi:hypothetical protein